MDGPWKCTVSTVAQARHLLLHRSTGTTCTVTYRGAGKTLIARAIAGSLGVHVATFGAAELLSSNLGEAEMRLTAAFDDARAAAPAVLFIDEAPPVTVV